MEATWKDIPGADGYSVNEQGEVRGRQGRILRQAEVNGYRTTTVAGRREYVHRLVLMAFVGPPPEGCEASHLNGDRHDNRVTNLRWETHHRNVRRNIEHGTWAHDEGHGMVKLTDDQVATIRAEFSAGESKGSLARRFDVSRVHIRRIVRGEQRKGGVCPG